MTSLWNTFWLASSTLGLDSCQQAQCSSWFQWSSFYLLSARGCRCGKDFFIIPCGIFHTVHPGTDLPAYILWVEPVTIFLSSLNKPFYTIGCLVPFLLLLFFTNVYPTDANLCNRYKNYVWLVATLQGILEWDNHHNIKLVAISHWIEHCWILVDAVDSNNKGLQIYLALTAKHAIIV